MQSVTTPTSQIDLWPHRLFWLGYPRALAFFGVKVAPGEPGPWRGNRPWFRWRQKSTATKSVDRWLLNNEPHLRYDSYASINRFARWHRTEEYVVRLGATFIDIDCGRGPADSTAEESKEILGSLVAQGVLPPPSLLQFSGRGLWAFWLLQDQDNLEDSPFADHGNRELWKALQYRVANIVANTGLKVDRNSLDLSRVTRLHGSINGTCGRAVRYELVSTPDGAPLRYSLEELARFHGLNRSIVGIPGSLDGEDRRDLELEEHRRRQDEYEGSPRRPLRDGVDPKLSEWGKQGHTKLWQGRLRFLERVRVEENGGRIPHGSRFNLLRAYAYCFAQRSGTKERTEAQLVNIWRTYCEQSKEDRFSVVQVQSIADHAFIWARNGGKISNLKLASLSGLDPNFDREKIRGLGLNLDTGLKGRTARMQERRGLAENLVLEALSRGDQPPSARELARELVRRGCQTGHSTAHALLKEFAAWLPGMKIGGSSAGGRLQEGAPGGA